ncbi:MAG: hypothetical protein RLY20_3403 [Verrucomicrobiota bacterium]|jgi:TPR repeat protein
MKTRNHLGVLLILALPFIGTAQIRTNASAESSAPDFLTNIFEPGRPMSCVAELSVNTEARPLMFQIGVCYQDGNYRFYHDLDVTLKNAGGDAESIRRYLTQRFRGQMNRTILLYRKGDPARYVIYPDRLMYHTNQPISFSLAREEADQSSVNLVPMRDEFVGGELCSKVELHFSNDQNSEIRLYLWRSKDDERRPVQLTMGDKLTVRFMNLKFEKLDSKLFEVPADCKLAESFEDILPGAKKLEIEDPAKKKADLDARLLKWHLEQAEKGDAHAECQIGLRYRDGRGVTKDLNKAREFLQRAMDHGSTEAPAALVGLYVESKRRASAAKEPSGAGQAQRIPDMKAFLAAVTIRSAEYGRDRRMTNVTVKLKELLEAGPEGFVVDYKKMSADPVPGQTKYLTIKYAYCRTNHVETFHDGRKVSLEILVEKATE